MNFRRESQAYVDEEGRLVIPREVMSLYGLQPGSQVRIERRADSLTLRRPVTHLRKVYIEPTNKCNLACRTCIRNVWNEPLGEMSGATFDRIMEGARDVSPAPTVFFGGFGEPLAHPNIVEMVEKAKSFGATVELITNGTLLTPDISRKLIEADLDTLWVSIDGATPESYADVRLGATLPVVLENITQFNSSRFYSGYFGSYEAKPQIGIVFVAMKRNIADLPSVLQLRNRLGATRFLITNVLPYSPDMREEILYSRALAGDFYLPSLFSIELPMIDLDDTTRDTLFRPMQSGYSVKFAGLHFEEAGDWCPFIEKGATAVAWNGDVCPCLPLLHNHVSYLNGLERHTRRYCIGNVNEQGFHALWNLPEYVTFRSRVQEFDFAFCTVCAGCDLSERNEEDCFGNSFPTCGGCLWAQGIIRCP